MECVNENDRFTVEDVNGNGDLTYPVSLLTTDEVVYAGFSFNRFAVSASNPSYLSRNSMFTLLSPMNYDGWVASVFLTYSDGIHKTDESYVGETAGIRPSVSLAAGTMAKGEGTSTNPYVVE